MYRPPSGPPPILPFVSTYDITAVQYFVSQGTRQQFSYNSIYFVSINRRPYNGLVYYEKVYCLTWILVQMLLIIYLEVVWHSIKQDIRPTGMLSSFKSVISSTIHHSKSAYFHHPYLSEEDIKSGCRLGLDYWSDIGCWWKHAYVDEFLKARVSM